MSTIMWVNPSVETAWMSRGCRARTMENWAKSVLSVSIRAVLTICDVQRTLATFAISHHKGGHSDTHMDQEGRDRCAGWRILLYGLWTSEYTRRPRSASGGRPKCRRHQELG